MSMKTLHIRPSNNLGLEYKTGINGFLTAMGRTVLCWQERASMRHHLTLLSEENLNDIGLSREETTKEASKYFWQH